MMIYRVVDALEAAGVRFAVAGGHAVALHGAVRGTIDLDLVLACTRENFIAAEKALKAAGLVSRLPVDAEEVFAFRKEYLERRNLVAWGFSHPKDASQVVDVVLTWELKPADVKRVRVGGRELPVLSKAALIAMKKAAGRPQDLADVAALEKLP
ncbi:MAG: hypothetical protein SF051_01400 [Elusimicrobiota bacterium]|nr:hypothetical protein [Elusimicrobiota bacterium]